MKKLISLVLVLAMVLAMAPGVFAAVEKPASMAIVGSGLSGIALWDPADAAGDMTEVSEGVYAITLPVTAGQTMVFKFTGNDYWHDGS